MATMKNVKKSSYKIEPVTCYSCLSIYTISSLDLFFACVKCKKYIKYMCDICNVKINSKYGHLKSVKCVKCGHNVCKKCATLFHLPFYIDSKVESICIECDMDLNYID